MHLYRFTAKSYIETANGNTAPKGLVVELACFGPSDIDIDKKLKAGLQARYGIETRSDFLLCHFDWEQLS